MGVCLIEAKNSNVKDTAARPCPIAALQLRRATRSGAGEAEVFAAYFVTSVISQAAQVALHRCTPIVHYFLDKVWSTVLSFVVNFFYIRFTSIPVNIGMSAPYPPW